MSDDYVNPVTGKPKSKRGFAAMSESKKREIQSKGGRAVKPENRFYYQERLEAAAAGAKGRASQGKKG